MTMNTLSVLGLMATMLSVVVTDQDVLSFAEVAN